MEPLGVNDNPKALELLTEEFIDGIKLGSKNRSRTKEEIEIMDDLLMKLEKNYNWTGKTSFTLRAMQKCSDMLVYVCKCPHDSLRQKSNLKVYLKAENRSNLKLMYQPLIVTFQIKLIFSSILAT